MAEKAMVLTVTDFTNGTGVPGVTVRLKLMVLGKTFEATALSNEVNPAGGWKPLIKAAAILAAAVEFAGEEVPPDPIDTVIFPDFTVL